MELSKNCTKSNYLLCSNYEKRDLRSFDHYDPRVKHKFMMGKTSKKAVLSNK